MAPKKRQSKTRAYITELLQHRMFKDRLFLIFVLTAIALCLAILFIGVFRLRPKDTVVPLQYSSIQGFNVLGEWWRNYILVFFSAFTTTGNIFLALRSFEKSRITSFFLVLGTILVNILILVVFVVLISHIEV